jgi:hypothetical protein
MENNTEVDNSLKIAGGIRIQNNSNPYAVATHTLARRVRELETEASKLRLDLATKTEAMDNLAKAAKELIDVADNMGYTHNDACADKIIAELRKMLEETGYGT